MRALASILAADTHPFITPRVKKYLMGNAGFDAAAFKAWQTHWLTTGLQAYEQRLVSDGKAGRFSHGDTVTIADICLASVVVIIRVFGIVGAPTCRRSIASWPPARRWIHSRKPTHGGRLARQRLHKSTAF